MSLPPRRSTPAPRPSCARGAASIRLIAALAGAALLVVALVLWLGGGGGERGERRAATAAEAPDRAPAEPLVRPDPAAPERESTSAAAVLTVPGGIPIQAGVRLPGVGRVEGRVLERGSGAPVPDVRVRLLPIPPAGQNLVGRVLRLAKLADLEPRVEPIATTGTDAAGAFSFAGVRQGTYYVEARGAWHVPDSVTRVLVAPSGAGGPLDVYVRPGGRIVGRVLQPDGRPVPGAKVAGYQSIDSMISAALAGDLVYMETVTDAEGAYALVGLPAGRGYEVSATGRGFCVSHAPGVQVEAGRDATVDVVTRQGAVLRGRILGLPLAEGEGGGSGEPVPLAGAHVGAVPHGLRDLLFAEEILDEVHATTAADGSFVLHHVPPGDANVIAWAPGFVPGWTDGLVLAEGGSHDAGELRLEAAPLARGRVVDGAGEPLAGVRVYWTPADYERLDFETFFAGFLVQALEGFEYPVTGLDGRFVAGPFAGDPPHELRFFKPGFEPEDQSWKPEDGELEVVLRAGGAIEGIVMDAERAVPVTRFTIQGEDRLDLQPGTPGNWNPFSGGQLVEDERGRFRVEAVEVGQAELTFTAPGYQPATVEDVEVVEGETTRGVIVKMLPGNVARGVVVDEAGAPVAGAFVVPVSRATAGRSSGGGPFRGAGMVGNAPPSLMGYVTSLGLAADAAVLTDPDGRFEVNELPTGTVDLVATHRSFAPVREQLLVEEGAVLEGLVLELTRGGGIRGRVVDRFDQPVAGTTVIAMAPEGVGGRRGDVGLYQGSSDENGEYAIEHVVAGSYFLVATRGDEALEPMSFLGTLGFDLVTVPPGKTVEHDLVDASATGCRVFGRVTADGAPVEGGQIVAMNFDTDNALGVEFKMARVRSDGSYEFPSLAPGDYSFEYQDQRVQARVELEVPDLAEYRRDVALPEGGFAGRVVDEVSGAPIERAQVTLESTAPRETGGGFLGAMISRQGRQESEYTDEDGSFAFERMAGGEYELRVQPPRWGPNRDMYAPTEPRKIELLDGRREEGVVLPMKPSLEIRGVVLDPDGQPVSGAQVVAWPREDDRMAPARGSSGDDGSFRLRSLGPRVYDLSAQLDGFGEAWLEKVEPGGRELELRLTRGVAVDVVVVDGGVPVSGAVATLVPLTGSAARRGEEGGRALSNFLRGEGVSSSEGRLSLGLFAPGEYRLEARIGSRHAVREPVRIEPGSSVVLEIRLD